MSKIRFIRRAGRIIPIKVSENTKNVAAATGVIVGSGILAKKLRQKTAETFQGKGKKSFGPVANLGLEVGTSVAVFSSVAKRSSRVAKGAFIISKALGRK